MTGQFSLGHAVLRFVVAGLGSIAIGLVIGFIMRWVQKHLDDPPVQITVSLLTPFVAYVTAERLHLSGVLATLTAGIYLGWHAPLILTARYRLQSSAFWQMLVFLLNGFVFITIGLQLPGILHARGDESISTLVGQAALIVGATIFVRIAWVFCAIYFPRWLSRSLRERERCPPWQEGILLAWSGMRGVVSLAAAFALPFALPDGRPFPGRNDILFFTFCVILATLVLQGFSLPLLIRKLGLRDDGGTDEEERQARVAANSAALNFIGTLSSRDGVVVETISRLRAEGASIAEVITYMSGL